MFIYLAKCLFFNKGMCYIFKKLANLSKEIMYLTRFFFIILFTFQVMFPLHGSLLEEIANLQPSDNKELPTPNPVNLHPQWWYYFHVEGEELNKRIQATNHLLQEVYASLPIEDKGEAYSLIEKISNNLNALPHVKAPSDPSQAGSRPFLKSYNLEKQLELYKQIRKIKNDIKSENDHFIEAKARLSKVQKNSDNLMVLYLGQTQPSTRKLLNGLEIMNYQTNIAIGIENLKVIAFRVKEMTNRLNKLEEELVYSNDRLDVKEFDLVELEKNMLMHEQELENSQKKLTIAETNLIGIFNDNNNDRSHHHILEQQLLQAAVSRAYDWAKLAFHTFKYNLIMHLNGHFEEKSDFRHSLEKWKEEIDSLSQQVHDWKKSALKDQDRIRHEYTALIALEKQDSRQLKNNQTQRQNNLTILSVLELLEEEISNTDWLINSLDMHFKKNSSFLINWWVDFYNFTAKTWAHLLLAMNYSLFKVKGVPITLLGIVKIILIILFSYWISLAVRSALISFGKQRGDINEATLYTLGGLARYLILLLGLIVALCSIGLDMNSFVFLAGALMFGISFGLQSIANNFFCGLRILFEGKLKIGDYIELHSGHKGKVCEIHIQNTVVSTNDGQRVIVPNSELISNTLVNWAKQSIDYRRLHIPFAVAVETDKELVRKVVVEAAKKVPCLLNHPEYSEPQVWLVNFDSYGLYFELVVWINYKAEAFSDSKEADFLWEIETALRECNIKSPTNLLDLFPVR